jgi:hypothetical protein
VLIVENLEQLAARLAKPASSLSGDDLTRAIERAVLRS